jgi:Tfp pilus assembly protein PilF
LLGRGSLAEFDAVTLNVAGDEYFSLGDLKRGKEAYSLGLSLDPQNRKLLNSYGVCLAGLRERKRAVDVFLKSINLYPDDFIACYNLGGIYLEQGKSGDAENILKKAHALEPNDQRVAIKYAEALCEAKKYEKAIDILKGASQTGKKQCHYSWHRAMGLAYFHMPGAWQNARKAFQNAIKINPKDVESLYFLALGYMRFAEDRDTAIRLFRQTENFPRDSARAKRIYGILTKTLDLNP